MSEPSAGDSYVSTLYDVAVVVPTVAFADVLLPTARRLLSARHPDLRVLYVFAFNSPDQEEADQVAAEIMRMPMDGESSAVERFVNDEGEMTYTKHDTSRCERTIIRAGEPIGFGAANNRGLMKVIELAQGIPELVVFHNDDAHVCDGWLDGMLAAARTKHINLYSEPYDFESGKPRASHPVEAHGRIGIVGPISNLVAGIQQAKPPDGMTLEQANEWAGKLWAGQRVTADFISGFCIGLTAECIRDLMLWRDDDGRLRKCEWLPEDTDLTLWVDDGEGQTIGVFDEDHYPIAGYEDNDLCVRAELGGWRCIVANDVFVAHIGHQTFDRLFPDALRGMRNRLNYYRKWAPLTQGPHRLIAVMRVGLEVPNDLVYLKSAVSRALQICDGIAIVLTNNPLDVRNTMEWGREQDSLTSEDHAMLKACSGTEEEGAEVVMARVETAFADWLGEFSGKVRETRFGRDDIHVEVWRGDFNERDERNRSIEIGEVMGADWMLSIDHDEFIENRVWRPAFDKLMSHPDPLVRSYDFSWLNHWDSTRMCRIDRPWGDNGDYVGGMHGFRLWRVTKGHGRRIVAGTANGLHCGNSPDHDLMAKRVCPIRFRHYGYAREQDRVRKYRRYLVQDPTPEPSLIGGNDYSHIINDESARMSPYVRVNGLGLHMLLYEGEKVDDVARLLDQVGTLFDRKVFVWTGEWTDDDKRWLDPFSQTHAARLMDWGEARDAVDEEEREAWLLKHREPMEGRRWNQGVLSGAHPYETGPSPEVRQIIHMFGGEWVHKPLNQNLAQARNAGIDTLQMYAREGIGWAMFLDPDEWFQNPYQAGVKLRRMAEASDVHGWLFEVTNLHEGAPPTQSESVRITRLIPHLRMSGRVHEGFQAGLKRLREEAGVEGKFRISTVRLLHRGLAKEEAAIDAKLRMYQDLLLLQLMDDPQDSGAWMSLGLHLLNDAGSDPDREDQAVECFRRGIACEEAGYLPFRELAMHHLRKAKVWLGEAMRRAGPGMPWHKANRQFAEMLEASVPDMPLMGSARRGVPVCPPIELPDFQLAEEITIELGAVTLGETKDNGDGTVTVNFTAHGDAGEAVEEEEDASAAT